MATNGGAEGASTAAEKHIPLAQRETDAVYQKNRYGQERAVGRVADVEVDETGKEILFGGISEATSYCCPSAVPKWVVHVKKIASAMIDKANPHRGRVLKG
jgi:hypothetical protein